MVWQVQDTVKLINLYRTVPELWNPDHADYKNKTARRAALTKLAEGLDLSTTEIEKKLRGLRTQFAREHLRESSGQKSVWFGYQSLLFLAKGRKCIFMDDSQTESWEYDNIDAEIVEFVTPEENDVGSTVSSNEDKVRIVNPEYFNSAGSKRSADVGQIESYKKYKRSASSSFEQTSELSDEYASFANCVVHKLRNIKSARSRSIAQYYINSILFQAEMTNYDEEYELELPKDFHLFRKARNTE
ncbi:uncharacterized protein LOC135837799 [Planococcus citri]|uniref:uncharacterized protein LOC135837799 n=1 Tax=Planococcus citri TaxID=170843 RepID=UPI0031F902E6